MPLDRNALVQERFARDHVADVTVPSLLVGCLQGGVLSYGWRWRLGWHWIAASGGGIALVVLLSEGVSQRVTLLAFVLVLTLIGSLIGTCSGLP